MTRNHPAHALAAASLFLGALPSQGIEIVLDFTLDEQNYNWFDPATSEGMARRQALESAAGFLSTIIRNDDWNSLPTLNESFSFRDLSESSINDLDGNPVAGAPDPDGTGYVYSSISTTNRSSVGANQYIVYVGAFVFDSGTSSHAIGGWDSNDRRNAAGMDGTEFNTWGGRIYFDIGTDWYAGSNPGINPTNDYGIQDPDKSPSTDISTDNWDWHTTLLEWKGFQLSTIDPSVGSAADLYGVGLHELLHALGLTNSNFINYIGVDANGDAIGPHLVAEYGGPVPRSSSGGHFDYGTQAEVWDSEGIISEANLDPSTTNGNRKYLTRLDAAALRDLGYDVAATWAEAAPALDLLIDLSGAQARLDWTLFADSEHTVHWSTDLVNWTSVAVGTVDTWTDPAPVGTRRYYQVTR
ncbi:MAG: hypothetical protein HKN82_20150 [Akkermansiaceae bacterium]|nr:hypothetical protein [Akkermansiaceae bacterium]